MPKGKYEAKKSWVNYGFLISGASEEDKARFTKFLKKSLKAVNFQETTPLYQIKAADAINIISIGHGSSESESINGFNNNIVSVITSAKADLEKFSQEKELQECLSKKVKNFRLQVCHQGRHAEASQNDIKSALESFNSKHEISFSCPQRYSHLTAGQAGEHNYYQDTNATSYGQYGAMESTKTLKSGDEFSFSISVEAAKNKNNSKAR
jgi:hypothetical protein